MQLKSRSRPSSAAKRPHFCYVPDNVRFRAQGARRGPCLACQVVLGRNNGNELDGRCFICANGHWRRPARGRTQRAASGLCLHALGPVSCASSAHTTDCRACRAFWPHSAQCIVQCAFCSLHQRAANLLTYHFREGAPAAPATRTRGQQAPLLAAPCGWPHLIPFGCQGGAARTVRAQICTLCGPASSQSLRPEISLGERPAGSAASSGAPCCSLDRAHCCSWRVVVVWRSLSLMLLLGRVQL